MSFRGQMSSVLLGSVGNFFGSIWMSRVSVGKLSFSTTESMCFPSMVSLIVPYGHAASHIPQKLHFARSMSTLALCAFCPCVLGSF